MSTHKSMKIPETQVAFGFRRGEKNIVRYDKWPVTRPKDGEVLVEVKAAGLCQSDVHIVHGQPGYIPDELVMGHEIAGQIVEVGGQSVPDDYQVGERVAIAIASFCGICDNCRSGFDNNCLRSVEAYGLTLDGGFQQFLLIKNLRGFLPIPDQVTYEQAAIASDAVLTPFHAINKARQDLVPTAHVWVMGLGGLGLNALQILRNYGCTIVAVDIKPEAKKLAKEYGATEFFLDISESDYSRQSFDVCFDFCGFQETFDVCQEYVKARGRIDTVGLGRSKLFVRNFELARKEVKINFNFGGTSQEQVECMKWVAQGRIKPLSTAVPFNLLPDYLNKLAQGKVNGRVVFHPSKL